MPKIILIVGASGVGKDTLLKHAKTKINANFVKRHITRIPDSHEDNYYINDDDFYQLRNDNYFIASWSAHNNLYGIAKNQIQEGLNIVSISRSAICDFERHYEDVTTIEITLSKEHLYQRLKNRNREDEEAIQERISRSYPAICAKRFIQFENDKAIEEAVADFIRILTHEF